LRTNIPVVIIDKDGINTGQGNQGANYNANPHATELVLGNTSSNNHGMTIVSPSSGYGNINFSDGSGGGLDATRGGIVFTHSDNKLSLKSKIGSIVLNHKDSEQLSTTDTGVCIGILTATSITSPKYDGDARKNIILGSCAGLAITDTVTTAAYNNIIMGHCAAERLCHGNQNVFLGSCAGQYATCMNNAIAIGAHAGRNANAAGGGLIAIGFQAGMCNTIADGNTFIGVAAGKFSTGSAAYNFYGGYGVGQVSCYASSDNPTGGACNVALGFHAFGLRAVVPIM